jgi:serine/threonine protein kinase
MAPVVTEIVLAMRYLHFCRIIHRDLKPSNIFVDWDWIVRIGDFSHAVLADACGDARSDETTSLTSPPSIEVRYTAPESFDNCLTLKSDVFSFGLILFELLTGTPAFSPDIPPQAMMMGMVIDKVRPDLPEFIFPEVRELICDCLEEQPSDRPSFAFILWRLNKMDFRITAGVRPEKVREFVSAVKRREVLLGIEMDDFDRQSSTRPIRISRWNRIGPSANSGSDRRSGAGEIWRWTVSVRAAVPASDSIRSPLLFERRLKKRGFEHGLLKS